MALMRCPQCHEICGDFPDVKATNEDGTAVDTVICFDCVCENLEGYPDDAA